MLAGYDGMLVPGGFGERGIEGKIEAIRFAREQGIPFFGICLGMQCAVIEFARNVCGPGRRALDGVRAKTPRHPVICLLDEQKTITDKGGTMRLGAQPAKLDPGEQCAPRPTAPRPFPNGIATATNSTTVYRQQFIANGMMFAGTSPDGSLVEIVELPDHRWFLAVQFHPEFKSKPTNAHPLFAGLRRRDRASRGKAHRRPRSEEADAPHVSPRSVIRDSPRHQRASDERRKKDHHRRRLEDASRQRERAARACRRRRR